MTPIICLITLHHGCTIELHLGFIYIFRSIRRSQNKGRAEEMKRSDMAKESEMTKNALAVSIGGRELVQLKFFYFRMVYQVLMEKTKKIKIMDVARFHDDSFQ